MLLCSSAINEPLSGESMVICSNVINIDFNLVIYICRDGNLA
jgi:hypothetical protein